MDDKNLQLNFDKLTSEISASNTNNPTASFITWAANHYGTGNTAITWCTNNLDSTCTERYAYKSSDRSTGTDAMGSNYDDYGSYYNYYTATAGHGTASLSDEEKTAGDICPSGWRLPIGGASKEAYYLNYYVNNGSTTSFTNLGPGTTFNMPFAGYVYNGTIFYTGDHASTMYAYIYNGNVWYQSSSTNLFAYYFGSAHYPDGSNADYVRYNYGAYRYSGYPVRCIADERKYTLYYNSNGGTGAPAAQNTNNVYVSSNTFTVSSTTPTRNGFTFNGWYFEDAPNILYHSGDTVTVSTSNSSVTYNGGVRYSRTLLASWTPSRYMQTVANWGSSVAKGSTVYAVDNRDNSVYSVARLNDGKLWMTRNLRLELSNLVNNISAANTNNPSSAFTTAANAKPTATTDAWCTEPTDATCRDSILYYSWVGVTGDDVNGTPKDEYGVYYNAYTATAGHANSTLTGSQTAAGDICPYNWKLPTADYSGGDWYNLNLYYNSGSLTDPSGIYNATILNMPHSGYRSGGSNYAWGTYGGRFWAPYSYISSSTPYQSYFGLYTDPSDSANNYVRYSYGVYPTNGNAVRCVSKENAFKITYTTSEFDSSEILASPSPVASFGSSASFTITSTIPTRANFTFGGWLIYGGDGTVYQPGATVTVTTSDSSNNSSYYKRLYPKWTPSYYMHNVASWGSSISVGQSVIAVDIRDGKEYSVGRLEDGKLWMKENLGLDLSALKQNISAANTNNPTSAFISAANAKPAATAPASWCTTNDAACNNQIMYYYNGTRTYSNVEYKTGTYMNFYTAMAGNWTYGTSLSNGSPGDICPYGWKIPVGNKSWSEFTLYNDLVNNGVTTDTTNLMNANMNLQLTGYISSTPNLTNITWTNYTWTRTNSGTIGYGLYIYPTSTSSKLNTNVTLYSKQGNSVRCIAKEYASVTVTYGGSGNLDGIDVDGVDVPHNTTISLEAGEPHTFTLGNLTGGTFTNWGFSATTGTQGAGSAYTATNTNTTQMTIVFNKKLNISIWPDIAQATNFDNAYAIYGKSKYNGYYKMQDMTVAICHEVDLHQTGKLIDVRDGQIYSVIRATDNQCWMTENLRLGAASLSVSQLDSTNTDMRSGSIAASTWNSYNKTSSGLTATYNSGEFITTQYSTTDAYGSKYGVAYNYYAASLGSVWGSSNTSDATQTICPTNWTMPAQIDFEDIISENSLTATTIQRSPFYFPLAGYGFSGTARSDVGTYGRWWGGYNTPSSTTSADHMYATSGGTLRAEVGDRRMANSVRCVAPAYNG